MHRQEALRRIGHLAVRTSPGLALVFGSSGTLEVTLGEEKPELGTVKLLTTDPRILPY